MKEGPNLERALNPCCGWVTDSCKEIPEVSQALPNVGDLAVCLNCGTILVYTKAGTANQTRLARRQEIELAPKKWRRILAKAQKDVRQRGRITPPPSNQ